MSWSEPKTGLPSLPGTQLDEHHTKRCISFGGGVLHTSCEVTAERDEEYPHRHSDKAVSRFISSKCCILEEELKTVIAATKSLEAQVEKVRRPWSAFPDAALRPRTQAVEWRKTAFQPGFVHV